MDDLLKEILKTEKEAQKILDDAKTKCQEIKKKTIYEKKELEKNSEEILKKELENIEKIEKENYLKKIEEIEKFKKQEIEKLKMIFLEKNKFLVEEIVFNVIRQ